MLVQPKHKIDPHRDPRHGLHASRMLLGETTELSHVYLAADAVPWIDSSVHDDPLSTDVPVIRDDNLEAGNTVADDIDVTTVWLDAPDSLECSNRADAPHEDGKNGVFSTTPRPACSNANDQQNQADICL